MQEALSTCVQRMLISGVPHHRLHYTRLEEQCASYAYSIYTQTTITIGYDLAPVPNNSVMVLVMRFALRDLGDWHSIRLVCREWNQLATSRKAMRYMPIPKVLKLAPFLCPELMPGLHYPNLAEELVEKNFACSQVVMAIKKYMPHINLAPVQKYIVVS